MANGFAGDFTDTQFFLMHPADPELYPDRAARFVCSECWWGIEMLNGRCRKCGNHSFVDLGEAFLVLRRKCEL
jgi:hypothetical protein